MGWFGAARWAALSTGAGLGRRGGLRLADECGRRASGQAHSTGSGQAHSKGSGQAAGRSATRRRDRSGASLPALGVWSCVVMGSMVLSLSTDGKGQVNSGGAGLVPDTGPAPIQGPPGCGRWAQRR